MIESTFSPSWYRVAGLRPKLRSHAEIHRHYYRGQLWYVLQDSLSGRYHRFTPTAYHLIALMDGRRSVQTIWDMAVEHLGDDAPTQDEMIRLLAQLHTSDVLLCDVSPDNQELFRRHQRQERQKWRQRFWSPLSLRFPLLDPDAFLERWKGAISPWFGWTGVMLWLAVVGTAFVLGASHWRELTENVTDQVLSPGNLVVLLLVYPLIKALHELGHAFATKIWGGEVHEMGIMLIVFMPMPYVDASAASAFRDKRKRMAVGAAGMIVELFLAAMALFVWLNVEPGVVRSVAYNVILIGSVSTLFFNGNPLLRFDGYYIFSDALEIPNLASRANQYLGYLAQRYLFGVSEAKKPAESAGEKAWLAGYGLTSAAYRVFILVSIVLFVAQKFFIIGVLLAVWGLITGIGMPIWRWLYFLVASPAIQRQRTRAVYVSVALLSSVLALLLLVPFPLYTCAEGVVWLPEKSHVRAETAGFVRRMRAAPNTPVPEGALLFELEDPLLAKEMQVLEFRLQELAVRYHAQWREDMTKAQIIQDEIAATRAALNRTRERMEQLHIRSAVAGVFIVPRADDVLDQWLKQGAPVAYVMQYPVRTVRAVVTQDRIGLVRQRIRKVEVRPVDRVNDVYAGEIEREVPAALDQLPSMALGEGGGGEIPIDPADRQGLKAFETVFQFDVRLASDVNLPYLGSRVYVRFDHGAEPLAWQWYRKGRQLFLRKFSV
jgi:putative peptide zinc metalloprotease protein